jgi:hypothetical protein
VENFGTCSVRQSLSSNCVVAPSQSAIGGTAMTVKVDRIEPNIFPTVEYVDARDAGRNAEVIFGVNIEGRVIPVTIKLSHEEADTLATLLEPFRKSR